MKKLVCYLCFVIFANLSFALPNMFLYFTDEELFFEIKDNAIYSEDAECFATIQDGKLYEPENNAYVGTIEETDVSIKLNISEEDAPMFYFEFDKKTGYINKSISYIDGVIDSSMTYEYKKGKLSKIIYYNQYNLLDCSIEYEYDKKTGRKIKESEYDNNDSPKTQTLYDKNTGKMVERITYNPNSKKPTKWTFLSFDEEGTYTLNENYYLNTEITSYWQLEDYETDSKDNPIEWNETYSARIRKYDFTANDAGYTYIKMLKDKHYLSELSFTLCDKNSNLYYCFDIDENNEIDISSCYEIELIRKPKNYPAMNKSGKGNGPFGLDIGMTYDEIKAACDGNEPEHIADDRYYIKPKKSHPLFEKYIVWISDSVGLYYIKGISRDIQTSNYGTEAKREFDKILSPLEKKYGKFKKTDTVKSDYYLKDSQYWMSALRDGARTYRADWFVTKDNYRDYDGLAGILLGIDAVTSLKAYIWLEYEFLNHDDARNALDDVL